MPVINCVNQSISPFKIAIIVSRFNQEVTDKLLGSALAILKENHFNEDDILVVHTPGAVEIPIVADKIARCHDVEAIIALGAVIRGETTHYDYVCEQVSEGCQQVMMQSKMPVIFGVLTTENKAQALARAGGAHSDKGRESVMAAFEMISVLRQL